MLSPPRPGHPSWVPHLCKEPPGKAGRGTCWPAAQWPPNAQASARAWMGWTKVRRGAALLLGWEIETMWAPCPSSPGLPLTSGRGFPTSYWQELSGEQELSSGHQARSGPSPAAGPCGAVLSTENSGVSYVVPEQLHGARHRTPAVCEASAAGRRRFCLCVGLGGK